MVFSVMKILVLNWGVAKEYSWHHSLFQEMVFLGADITVVSARKAWDPRGGQTYPEAEKVDGVRYVRMFADISDFKATLNSRIDDVVQEVGEDFDILWTFHQANWTNAIRLKDRLKSGCRHVLVCEQAFRTSGWLYGQITERWREIQSNTDLIISWAPRDQNNEGVLGVKYLPFGGCYKGIEDLVLPWGWRCRAPYAIYQGTLTGAHKNQEGLYQGVRTILDSHVVDYFVVNGYAMDDVSQDILERLKREFGNRFVYKMLIGRDRVFKWLRGALFGFSPMKPDILSNFPFEALGVGVPMWMPHIENPPSYIQTDWKALCRMIVNRRAYEAQVTRGRAYYDMNLSTEIMGQQYFNALEGVL